VAKIRYNKPTLESLVKSQVRLYWNSHKKLFSVQAPYPSDRGVKWIVVGHTANVQLTNCTFQVSAAGHRRALREGVKNVHAFVRGTLAGVDAVEIPEEQTDVLYNVYPVRSVWYSLQDGCFATRIGVDVWRVYSSPQVWLTCGTNPIVKAWNPYTNLDELYKTL